MSRHRRGLLERLGIGPVAAEHECVDAEDPDDRLERALTGAGGVDVDIRVNFRPAPAAQRMPLGEHRPEAGAGSEDQLQAREQRAAANRVPAPPGSLQLGGVADDRRPPRRQALGQGMAGLGPGMDEDRLSRELGRQQQLRLAVPGQRGEQVRRRQLEADEAVI